MTPNIKSIIQSPIALAIGAGAAMFILLRPKDAANMATKIGAGVIDVTGDLFQGVVSGVTGGVIPATSESACCAAISEQRQNETFGGAFKISGVCPAADYLSWAFTGKSPCDSNAAVSQYVPPEATPGSVLSGGGINTGTSFESMQCGLFDFYCNDNTGIQWLDFVNTTSPSFTSVAGVRG